LLVLPRDDQPLVSVFEDARGRWVAETADATWPVSDREVVIAGGEGWILDLPVASATWEAGQTVSTLETIALRLAVSRDEEHVEVTVLDGERATALPSRTYHYLLLTLARAVLADQDKKLSPGERGWLDREELCRMLATDSNKLNVDIFRARKQFSALGIQGAAGIIARRPGTGQLRLGLDRVDVTRI
jgi:hypothetical protein